MTMSFKKLGKGSGGGEYYIEAAQVDDYYLNDGVTDDKASQKEPPGKWFDPSGSIPGGVTKDGDEVRAGDFRALLGGYDPVSGKALIKGAGDSHVSGYDFTFSAPKGVSVLWSQLPPELREKMELAQDRAVKSALGFLSEKAGISRRGKAGVIKESINLIAALWPHGSSRENDPQMHTHCTVMNIALCSDGKYRTIDTSQMLKWQSAAAGVYHTQLAAELMDMLGVRCEVKDGEFIFDLTDVPENVKEFFSKRSVAIKKAAKELPTDAISKAVLDKLTLETRNKKSELTRAELLAMWVKAGAELGFTEVQAVACFNQAHREPMTQGEIRALADMAATRLTYTHSVFNEAQAYAMIGVMMQGRGTVDDIKAAGEYLVNESLVKLGVSEEGIPVFSTPEMVALERRMIEDAKTESLRFVPASTWHGAAAPAAHVQPRDVVEAAILAKKGMSDEQADAVRHACLDRRMVSIVEGAAGAGKSFTMEAVKQVYEKQGYTIHGLALSWSAAGVLSDEAKIAYTRAIEGFVRELQTGKLKLDEKCLVLVDEAGLVGSRHMAAILSAAKAAGAKVILTGDSKQLAPVEAGGALEAIVEEIGSARIDTIRRQKEAWQRDAVRQFADGQAEQALQAYEAHGLVHFADDHDTAVETMVADWNAYRTSENAGTALLLANDNATVRELNERVRNLLRQEGRIGEDATTIKTTDMKKTADVAFAVGDRIMFRKNDKKLGINGDPTRKQEAAGVYNRTAGTIQDIRVGRDGVPIFRIKLDKGGSVEIRAGKGGYWDAKTGAVPLQHAYATTIYGSQGMTVDRAFLLDSSHIERRLAYVGMSRHREQCRVYIDRQAVYERMMERVGSDEFRTQSQVSDDELLQQVTKSWSRSSEKKTTVQFIKEMKGERKKDAFKTSEKTQEKLNSASMKTEGVVQNLSKFKQMSAEKRRERAEAEYNKMKEMIGIAKTMDLPHFLQAKLGVSLKKDGDQGGMMEEKPTGPGEKRYHFFKGSEGHWMARCGNDYQDAITHVQERTGLDFKETVALMAGASAGNVQSNLAITRRAENEGRLTHADRAVARISIRQASASDAKNVYHYAQERGISKETLQNAHKQGFARPDDRGLTFLGYDHGQAHKPLRSAETRFVKPQNFDGEYITKYSYAGSDKTFCPILRGNPNEVHIVEGGFNALALHDIAARKGKEPPTVIVTGGARSQKWLSNPEAQKILKAAAEHGGKIVDWKENEFGKKTGLPDPTKQQETDMLHDKQIAGIKQVCGRPECVKSARPPEGIKDLAAWNQMQQAQQHQQQLELEQAHRGLRR